MLINSRRGETGKIEYPAILTPAEEGGFLVDFPDFGGEVFTEGDTLDEALCHAANVLALVLEDRQERGRPIPTPGRINGPNVYLVAPRGYGYMLNCLSFYLNKFC